MFSVPPDTGVAVPLADGVVDDDELHAASPTAASTAAASPAARVGALIMGVFPLVVDVNMSKAATKRPGPCRSLPLQERLCVPAAEIQIEVAVVARL
jgi:hypothetical protein